MKLVFIFGDAAAGKMTVGQELSKITDLKLFHNHMSIEPVIELFGTLRPDLCDEISSISRNLSEQNSDMELLKRRFT